MSKSVVSNRSKKLKFKDSINSLAELKKSQQKRIYGFLKRKDYQTICD